ncbi:MAG: hypothetical protein NT027_06660 [Proteobacteria bacterium]|nr:hypothetical protein [Pseudomonadota bacterium]
MNVQGACSGNIVVRDCVTDAEGGASMMANMGLSAAPPSRGRAKENGRE